MKKILVAVFSVFVITACSEVKSYEYYLENEKEANEVVKECEVSQMGKHDQNCINAEKAVSRIALKKMIGVE